jgi:hypothetical protein
MMIRSSGRMMKSGFLFCLLQAIALIIYLPILTNNFLADDYRVMNRVGLHGEIFVEGFFRPLSDISLYLNYMLAGVSPFIYYLTNIFFHGCCSFMIFIFCKRINFVKNPESDKSDFSIFAAVLFLTYPFHNESIAWIVGRASLLATFFGLACLLVASGNAGMKTKYFFSGLFYFIGLLAYESIFPLPVIVFLLSWARYKSVKIIIQWTLVFVMAIILHLVLRVHFSGVVTGEYGQDLFSLNLIRYLSNILKITGRMLLPPSDNSSLLVVCFIILIIFYIIHRIVQRPKLDLESAISSKENQILLMLAVALIVPITFSVSTRTSEGDRLLYFPSVFLCLLFSYLMVTNIRKPIVRIICLCFLIAYNIVFLEINNFHWKKASRITESVLEQVVTITGKSKEILLFNVPGEYKGAYIFRNAFKDALLIKGIDTADVNAINYLNHAEYQLLPDSIFPTQRNDSLYPAISVIVSGRSVSVKDFNKPGSQIQTILLSGKEELWYWNKHEFILLRR